MRRLFLIALSLSAFAILPAQAALDTSAEHGLLLDAATGQVLWQKDGMVPIDRKSTRLNSSHVSQSRMPSSA